MPATPTSPRGRYSPASKRRSPSSRPRGAVPWQPAVSISQATDAANFALAFSVAAKDALAEADAWRALSIIQLERTDAKLDLARPLAEAALSAAVRSGDRDALARARFRLANALIRGNRPEGRSAMQEVATSLDVLDDPRLALKALSNLAQLEFRQGNLREAALIADRLAESARRYSWIEGEAMAVRLWRASTVLRQPELAAGYLHKTYDRLLGQPTSLGRR